jgi:hypothetical protein
MKPLIPNEETGLSTRKLLDKIKDNLPQDREGYTIKQISDGKVELAFSGKEYFDRESICPMVEEKLRNNGVYFHKPHEQHAKPKKAFNGLFVYRDSYHGLLGLNSMGLQIIQTLPERPFQDGESFNLTMALSGVFDSHAEFIDDLIKIPGAASAFTQIKGAYERKDFAGYVNK